MARGGHWTRPGVSREPAAEAGGGCLRLTPTTASYVPQMVATECNGCCYSTTAWARCATVPSAARSRNARHTRVRYDKVRLAVNCRLGAARCLVLSSAHSHFRHARDAIDFSLCLCAANCAAASDCVRCAPSRPLHEPHHLGRDFASHAQGKAATIGGLGFFSRGRPTHFWESGLCPCPRPKGV